jgi:cytochrome c biogenesis protein CcmG/thiol:disulfide interchange protein DsbE
MSKTPAPPRGSEGARPSLAEGGERSGEGAVLSARGGRRAAARLWFLIPLGAFLALALVLAVGLKLDPREVPSPLIDKPAPKFALARLDDAGKTVRLDDLKGKVFILNVWASWCVACREEHPVLLDFAKKRVVPVYGLNYKDTRPDASAWLARFGDPYDASFFDEDGRVGLDFGVYGVPETFIVDGNGVIRMKHIGPITPEVLANKIEPLLKKLDA